MEFKLPDIGEGVHEGEIVKWLVKPGDSIKEDQPLVEVMTDKATVEIPSTVSGKIEKIHAKEGAVIKVGQAIATIAEGASSATAASAPAATAAAPRPQPVAPVAAALRPQPAAPRPQTPASGELYIADPGQVMATPATRRLARELGVDLKQVSGSGPQGRVTKDDLQRYAGASAAGPHMYAPATTVPSVQARGPALPQSQQPVSPLDPHARETLVPFRGMRRKIAEGMRHSKDTAAHFTYVEECDVTELVQFRNEAKKIAEEQGIKLTFLPFLVKAAIQALKKFPYLNSSLDEQGGNVILKNYYNIGIAVDTDDGLIVPVVKDADKKSILQLAAEIQILAQKAHQKKLSMDELKGGTFTITNAGTIGGLFATPIINHPEVAILGFNKIAKRPAVKGDQIVIADMTWFSISIDHRIVDGAVGARFMNEFISYLSHPKKLMLGMI